MRLRSVGAVFVFFSLGGMFGTVSSGPVAEASGEPLPNVLIFMTDDQRGRGTLGVMPHVRRLFVQEGRRFPRAIATTPVCCPSRASLFTGRYAHNHGVLSNREGFALDHETTMQRYLQNAGYRTGYIGKFLNGWPLEQDPPHFDRWALLPRGYWDPDSNVDGDHDQLDGYSTDLLRRYANDLLTSFENSDQEPWLLVVAPLAPHPPATPETSYRSAPVPQWVPSPAVRERNRSDKPPHLRSSDFTVPEARRFRRRQLRTLLSVDDLVAGVFDLLGEQGELHRTFAIYTSDNGYLWGEHGLREKGLPYTGSVSVPLLLRWPDEIAAGTVDRRLAANIDIFPTILDAAGLDGSLTPALDGASLFRHDRSVVLTEWLAGERRWASLTTRHYRYVEWYRRGQGSAFFREYYHFQTDPWELRNTLGDEKVGNDPPKARLKRRLERLTKCQGTSGDRACP
jgi:arylsulfatase A-like enzyme